MRPIQFDSEAESGLVSIIVPTYRKERYIGETLASIAAQKYARWELIVVEDGPRGGTEEIVADFARQHPEHRVHYECNERNHGAAYTRNTAFARARGEFVALLDSDDRWLPDHLDAAVKALQSGGKDIVYSTVLMIEDQTDLVLGVWGPAVHERESFPYGLFLRNFVTPSATVMRRKVLAKVGAWDNRCRYCEDADFFLRCVAAGVQFQHIGGCHCLYRKNHEGATTQRLCGALEEFAEIAARYSNIPSLKEKLCRKLAARAFLHAAHYHAISNPSADPSADRSRVGPLLVRAWQLRPRHVEYLVKGTALQIVNWFRRAKQATPPPAAVRRQVAA